MTYQEELKERILIAIVEEMQKHTQRQFIEALCNRLTELLMDEITFKLRR